MNYRLKSSDMLLNKIKFLLKVKDHPNILILEDVKRDSKDSDFFIQTEPLITLEAHIRNDSMSKDEILKMTLDILCALELYHENGFYCGNISPKNIFLAPDGSFKLGGFDPEPLFTAPESLTTYEKNIVSDIYCLALTAYMLLNNKVISFTPKDALTLAEADKTLPPPKDIDKELLNIINCAANPKASKRFKTPSAFKKALEYYISNHTEKQETATEQKKEENKEKTQTPITNEPVPEPKPKEETHIESETKQTKIPSEKAKKAFGIITSVISLLLIAAAVAAVFVMTKA
ncbi:MAG: hypothetical protein E7591_09245 [Ruminococcaceae bacterium]|nr:hypothetical protein [Oscillospiraceae bacterium]